MDSLKLKYIIRYGNKILKFNIITKCTCDGMEFNANNSMNYCDGYGIQIEC